ncbi:MAG: complex I NDUFA9 subunit family protein [Desulfuromonas sp.]|nr:complex I NDUFA9 subunit family protein [Desulfuromonas sp.]
MRIFITGASGFVGTHIVNNLVKAGHSVRCLVHTHLPSNTTNSIEQFTGDILEPSTLLAGASGCDAIIHLVGIIRPNPKKGITFARLHIEASKNIIQTAQLAGIKRYLHMSANGVGANSNRGEYLRTKEEAEALVRKSNLEWTIFRPSLIIGQGGDFTRLLHQQVQRLPTVPVIGDGNYKLMPVAVEDIAQGFTKALTQRDAIGQTYQCCGPSCYTYNELIDLFATSVDKAKVRKVHVPLPLIQPTTKIMQRFSTFPITSEQITMLLGGNTCKDKSSWYNKLGLTATPLLDSIKKALGK